MVQSLIPCGQCGCHVQTTDSDCPHCGAAMRSGRRPVSAVALFAGLSTASFIAACGDDEEPEPVAPSTTSTTTTMSTTDTTSTGNQVVAAYGVGGFGGFASTGTGGTGGTGGMGGDGGAGGN